ncbi:DUF1501 domain-containing protein [Phycicoccus avicenniae]|uniref:DUF1501 domain-containing protein n=1 Tax=Phycicoccus avicenniae TaxID=2828860 RepID=UPI003D283AF2
MPRPPYDPSKPLDGLTRRSLLRASGVVGTGALLAGGAGVGLHQLLARGSEDGGPRGTPILVLVTLYGGNDGLNTVVPYADPAYRAARPELAYGAEDVLRLDDRFGLNPALKGLAEAWGQEDLAIVHGVGYPRPDRSHFRSMDIWQTATPESPSTQGWLGRWLDAEDGDPMLAVSLGETLPPLAVGARSTAAALSLRTGRAPGGVGPVVRGFAPADPGDPPAAAEAAAAWSALGRCEEAFSRIRSTAGDEEEPDAGETPATGTGGNGSSVGTQLDLVARCIRAGVPTRAYAVSDAGYDAHTQLRNQQEFLLGRLDTALGGFRRALADHPRRDDVVVVVHSEFGRRVRANASEGTDHGTASVVLVLGSGVNGGHHGEPPSLTDLDDGDLRASTDFRSIYAEVAEKVLRVDPARVVPEPKPALGILV